MEVFFLSPSPNREKKAQNLPKLFFKEFTVVCVFFPKRKKKYMESLSKYCESFHKNIFSFFVITDFNI